LGLEVAALLMEVLLNLEQLLGALSEVEVVLVGLADGLGGLALVIGRRGIVL
jgi:hypothetical protein